MEQKLDEIIIGFGPSEPAILDEEQEEIVTYNGSQIVISGPGSGKTRILTEKARKLFNAKENLLCITFTRSAAREMGNRIAMIPATTIHSYCCQEVGWKEDWGYTGLLYRFLKKKDTLKFEWVLVDECQDLNELEYDVILSLSSNKIFAVGDPYQSIYGFQGAMGKRAISKFGQIGCKEFVVHNNYRSSPEIVSRLNKYYDRNLVSKNIKDVGLNAILFRKNEDLFYASKQLKERNFDHKIRLSAEYGDLREYIVGKTTPKWLLSTIHSSKGLEFDKVILFDWYPNQKGEEERVYYVAMSRAAKEFVEVQDIKELMQELEHGSKNLG